MLYFFLKKEQGDRNVQLLDREMNVALAWFADCMG
jgi:hypothetical protein